MRTTPGCSGRNSSLRPVSELKICSMSDVDVRRGQRSWRALARRACTSVGGNQRQQRREFRTMRHAGQRGAQRHEQRRPLASGLLADLASPPA